MRDQISDIQEPCWHSTKSTENSWNASRHLLMIPQHVSSHTERSRGQEGGMASLFFEAASPLLVSLNLALKKNKKKTTLCSCPCLLRLPWIPNMPYRTKTTLAENVCTPGWFHKSRITASSNTTAHGWKKNPPAERWSTERATASTERLSDVYYIIVWTFFVSRSSSKRWQTSEPGKQMLQASSIERS